MGIFTSSVTPKNQVTIPKRVRDNLGKVEFVLNNRGELPIKPVTRKVAEVTGLLSKYKKLRPVSIEEMDQAVTKSIQSRAL